MNEIEVQRAASQIIREGFESAGIKEGDEFRALAGLLVARKMTVDKYGEEHWESDNGAIGKGVELVLRLKRLLDTKVQEMGEVKVQHHLAPEDIGRLEDIAKELVNLEMRLNSDKVQRGEVIEVGGRVYGEPGMQDEGI